MKFKKSNLFLILFIAIYLLSGCTPKTNTPIQPTPTIPPITTIIPETNQPDIEISGYQPITPENIQNIELLKEIGSGIGKQAIVSPDGSLIAVLTPSRIMVYDRSTFREMFSVPIYGSLESYFTFSPDSKQIVFTANDSVSFLNIENREISNSFPLTDIFDSIYEISFTPDMDRLIIRASKVVANCDGFSPSYGLYSLDGTALFERNGCGYPPIHFHKALNNKQTLFVFPIYDSAIPHKIFVVDNQSGNILASLINSYDYEKEELIETITGNPARFFAMDQLNEWAKATDKLTPKFQDLQFRCFTNKSPFESFSIAYIDEFYALLKFSSGNSIAIAEFDMKTCQFTEKILYPTSAYQEGIFSPNGKFFFYSNGFNNNLLNLETGTYTFQESIDFIQPNTSEYAFNTDGSKLLIGPTRINSYSNYKHYEEMPIHIIDPSTGKILGDITPGGKDIYTITATPNPAIMMLEYDNRYSLWNIETGEYISSIPTGDYLFDANRNGIWILKPYKNNAHIVSLYDLSTGKLIKELDILHRSSQADMCLLEDNSVLNVSYTYDRSRICNIQLNIDDGMVLFQECSEEPDDEPSPKKQSTEYTDWVFRNYSPQDYILFRDNYGYNLEDQISDFDPFIITRDLTFWDKNSGEYLGELETNYWSMKTSFSANHYFLATWGDDYIIRIYGIPEESTTP